MRKLGLPLAGAALLATVVWLGRHPRPAAPPRPATANRAGAAENAGTAVTILTDFSASFAPYNWSDRLALSRIAEGIGELASRHWQAPVTIVWRRIGTASLLSPPLCPPIGFSPSLIGGQGSNEGLHNALAGCATAVGKLSSQTERYTDISGAVRRATGSLSDFVGRKLLVVFSDLREDPVPGTKPASYHLGGTTVLLVHRPGTDDHDPGHYLERIRAWAGLLQERGAATVRQQSAPLITQQSVVGFLQAAEAPPSSTVTLLIDFKDRFGSGAGGMEGGLNQVRTLLGTLSRLAASWTPPVAIHIGATASTALRMRWMPPTIFDPKLIPRPGQINRPEDLVIALEESLIGLAKTAAGQVSADLSGAIALSASGDHARGAHSYLFLVSDLVDSSAVSLANLQVKLDACKAVLIYRPASPDGADPNALSNRIHQWRERLRQAGSASVCAVDMDLLQTQGPLLRKCVTD